MTQPGHQSPYVGPRSFQQGEGDKFFGRERELDRLARLLIARRIVLLHSPSGAGKTSLINAALIPRLESEGFTVRRPIRLNVEVPREVVDLKPNRFLLATLMAIDEGLPEKERTPPAVLCGLDLRTYLERLQQVDSSDEVLIFDQFEELLTTDHSDKGAKETFIGLLGAALENQHRWALFAIREDYLGSLRPLLVRLPTRLDTLFRLDLLNEAQAKRAVQIPAQRAGVTFADEAATELINDLRRTTRQNADGTSAAILGDTIEPVQLQVVCLRIWERAITNTITVGDIRQAGDVDAALRAYFAERVKTIADATGFDERKIREWIEAHLITGVGLRGQVLRGAETTEGLLNTAVSRLVDAHLIRAEERRGRIWYELAHDRLIAPIQVDNAAWFELHLGMLQRRAAQWWHERQPESLLLRGGELVQAQKWAMTQPNALTPEEQEYLARSLQAVRRQRRERNLAIVAVIIAIIATVAMLAAGYSFQQSQAALSKSTQVERSQRLAIDAQDQLGRNVTRALLLAASAFAIDENPITYNILWRAVTEFGPRPRMLEQRAPAAQQSAPVGSVNFSPDGKQIVTGQDDGSVRIWNVETGTLVRTLDAQGRRVNYVAFNSDGSRILAFAAQRADPTTQIVLAKGAVLVWEASSGVLIQDISAEGLVTGAIFDQDGRQVVLLSKTEGDSPEGRATFWEIGQSKERITIANPTGAFSGGKFTPSGRRLALITDSGEVSIWTRSGEKILAFTKNTLMAKDVTFANDTDLATISFDGTPQLWSLQSYKPRVGFNIIMGAAGSPHG